MDFPIRLDSIREITEFLSPKHLSELDVESAIVISWPELHGDDHSQLDFLEDHFGVRPIATCCKSTSAYNDFYVKYGRSLKLMNSRQVAD
jgi:hypothetical protein